MAAEAAVEGLVGVEELELLLAEAAVVAVAAWVDLLLAQAIVVAVSASLGVAGVLELCHELLLAKPQRVLMEVAMAQCHPALLARLEQLTMVDVEALSEVGTRLPSSAAAVGGTSASHQGPPEFEDPVGMTEEIERAGDGFEGAGIEEGDEKLLEIIFRSAHLT